MLRALCVSVLLEQRDGMLRQRQLVARLIRLRLALDQTDLGHDPLRDLGDPVQATTDLEGPSLEIDVAPKEASEL